MKFTNEDIQSIVKTQMRNWVLAIFVATGYALFAKLIWTGKFPILIGLPFALLAFALASIHDIRAKLTQFVETAEATES